MDLGVERLCHLACGSTEIYKEAAGWDAINRKSTLR